MTSPRSSPPAAAPPEPGARRSGTIAFRFDDLTGELAACLAPSASATAELPAELAAQLRRLLDPKAATHSLHWGRNYLYRAEWTFAGARLPVVVKQFRCEGAKQRWQRARRGTKARLSWAMAHAVANAGVATPEPLLIAESNAAEGPAFYVCRYLDGVIEARHLLRAAAAGQADELFPEIDLGRFLARLGGAARRLHDAGIVHRDLSVGNVLIEERPVEEKLRGGRPVAPDGLTGHHGHGGESPRFWIIDLNRARQYPDVGLYSRMCDLCRLSLFRPADRARLLAGYFSGADGAGRPSPLAAALYASLHHLFQLRHRLKTPLAPLRRRLAAAVKPRRAHLHIPAVPAGASKRDKVVWDRLSDQPHQHASRAEKLAIRLADTGAHLEEARVLAGTLPRIWRRYRTLRQEQAPGALAGRVVPWDGLGLALRPAPADPEGLLAAVDELGVRRLLLRLHPWQQDHDAEEALARELAARGYELAFALPQNRELVRDPARWRAAIDELGERFAPFGLYFQVGQAINRSKWGVWRLQEYVDLYLAAAESLRRHPGVELMGPAVIDFEHYVTAAVLNLDRPGLRFDIVSALLYVDRRGAPENRQVGFDTVGKATLLKAIAETSRNGTPRCWITEFNWPLWEGPHSPAGKKVSVDDQAHADYIVRYFLLTLTTGLIERVYLWQLAARGYGLLAPAEDGRLSATRRRPAFAAVATLRRELEGADFLGALPAPEGARLYRFSRPDGGETIVGWAAGSPADPPIAATLPAPAATAVHRDGDETSASGTAVTLTSSPTYFRMAAG